MYSLCCSPHHDCRKSPRCQKGTTHTQIKPPREADAEREENEASKGPKAHNEEGQLPSPRKKGGVSRLGLTKRPGCLPGEADRQRMRHQADKLPEDDTSQTRRMKRVTRGCTRSRLKTELPAMAFWTQDRAVEPQPCPGGSAP